MTSIQKTAIFLMVLSLTACTNPLLIKHQAEQSSSASSVVSNKSSTQSERAVSSSEETTDLNIEKIKSYYQALSNHKLEKAYDMYSVDGKKKTSFAKFENWYKAIESAIPFEIIDFDESQSDYIVFVNLQNKDQSKETYRVAMNVSGGKITTMSSQKIEVVRGKNILVFIQKQAGVDTVMLVSNMKETMIKKAKELPKEIPKEFGGNCELKALTLSSSQKFITVQEICWEASSFFVYDIQKNAITLTLQDHFSDELIVNDEYFYACANNQFSGTFYANVYQTSDFSLIFDGLKKHGPLTSEQADFGIKCSFDEKKQSIQFKFLDGVIDFPIHKNRG